MTCLLGCLRVRITLSLVVIRIPAVVNGGGLVWRNVGCEPETIKVAQRVAKKLSRSGLRLTVAQVLRAGLAKGVRDLEADPGSLLTPPREEVPAPAPLEASPSQAAVTPR